MVIADLVHALAWLAALAGHPADRERWHQGSSAAFSRLLKRLKKSTDRGGFMTPRVHDAMTELVDGAAWTPWSEKPELLFPDQS